MKKDRKFLWIALPAILIVLALAFVWGDQTSGPVRPEERPMMTGTAERSNLPDALVRETAAPPPSIQPQTTPGPVQTAAPRPEGGQPAEGEASGQEDSRPTMKISPETGMDEYQTAPVPEGKPAPVEPQEAEVTEEKATCTLVIRCDVLVDQLDKLPEEKRGLVPADGLILPPEEVEFQEGESVFSLLERVTKEKKIHLEFTKTTVYNSAYIEGIGNLYELDAGPLSGWLYQVNGWFPGYGSSRYQIQKGDQIEWRYSCDLGRDIGGYVEGGQR